MAINAEQELINRITEAVTNNVLETVKKWLDDEKASNQNKSSEDINKAKETVRNIVNR